MKKATRIVVLMLFAGLISLSLVGCKKKVEPTTGPENQAEMMENEKKMEGEQKEAEKAVDEKKKDEHPKGEHPK